MKILFLLISSIFACQLHAMEIITTLRQFNQKLETLTKMLRAEITVEVEKPKLSDFLYYNLDENIFQRRVLQQVNNANCGYYALKDTLYTLHALEGQEQVKKLLSFYLTNKDIFNADYETWSKAIFERRADKANLEQRKLAALLKKDLEGARKISFLLDNLEKNIKTDWLAGTEIEWLYEHKTPNKPSSLLWTIDNIDWISVDKNYQGINPQGLIIFDNFRSKKNYQGGFLLNYAREYLSKEGKTVGGYGHWIGVVVTKRDSVFTYYITDSLNKNRTQDAAVLALKKIIEKENIINIKIILSGIQNYLDTINHVKPAALGGKVPGYTGSQDQAIGSILRNIQNTIQAAQKEAFFDTEEFKSYKQILLTTLHDIILTGKISDEFKNLIPIWLSDLSK